MGLRGKNRLRLHKLNVGLYPAESQLDREPIFLTGKVITANQDTTEIALDEVPDDFECGAIFLNAGEHAYVKVRFDTDSIDWITKNLNRMESA